MRFMSAALALGRRGSGQTGLNPAVGCIITKDARIIGRGWTQDTGRPHAEAMALAQAGAAAKGADIYVTLEPCAHDSKRGPACADSIAAAMPARVIIAAHDPDPRTAGKGIAILQDAGIAVEHGLLAHQAQRDLAGFFIRINRGRPAVTLKLALSLDGKIALADGASKWITGSAARAHTHLQRARHDAILVGGGTYRADNPALDVRLPGLEARTPARYLLTGKAAPAGWHALGNPDAIFGIPANMVMIEGGGAAAAAFMKADLVDSLLLYRAPIVIGGDAISIGDIGLSNLADAHGRWTLADRRMLRPDCMELYERRRSA